MKKKFKKIGLKLLSIPFFNKVRVFHQMLTVIGIMVVFLILIGYMGIRNIDSMQATNKKMFSETLKNMDSISAFKQSIVEYKDNYFQSLLDGNDNPYLRNNLISSMGIRVDEIKRFNEKKAQIIVADLNELKKVADLPVNMENYAIVLPKIAAILANIRDVEYGIQGNSYTMSSSITIKLIRSKEIAFIIILVSTIIAVLLGLFVSLSVSWPLSEIKTASKALASGDLAYEIKIFGCREITEVSVGLNNAMASLRELIVKISQQSEIISRSSNELKTAAYDSGNSAEEVARAMGELAQASTSQAEQVYQTADTVNYLGETVRHVSEETAKIAAASEKVAQSAVSGQQVTDEVTIEINELYNSTHEINQVIEELNQATKEIGQITSEITEIAEQTTLLALNASIEAARAGEQGKGFDVVAVETGKLAERSKQASQHISALTETMIIRTNQAAEVAKKGTIRAESGKDLAAKAMVNFHEIFKELREVVSQINDVALSAQNMNAKNESVMTAVDNMTAITEESMASNEEVSAAAQEQSAMAQQVTELSKKLTLIADEMRNSAAVFRI